jgi:hypothetical protein
VGGFLASLRRASLCASHMMIIIYPGTAERKWWPRLVPRSAMEKD